MSATPKPLLSQLLAARDVSTPLISVGTADPASAIDIIRTSVEKNVTGPDGKPAVAGDPVVVYDCVRGLHAIQGNPKGQSLLDALGANKAPTASATTDPLAMALVLALAKFPEDATLVVVNAHLFWTKPPVIQAIWNCRDGFKKNGRQLILLRSLGATLPPELTDDVHVLEEPLPSEDDLTKLVKTAERSANVKLDEAVRARAVGALTGLPSFPAEQTLAMNLDATTGLLNEGGVWSRKGSIVSQTRGLSIAKAKEKFADIGGLSNAKTFFGALLDQIRVVVQFEELEKAIAGVNSPTDTVKGDMLGQVLDWMENDEVDASLFLGPPGAGKSLFSKSFGNEARVPTIVFDFAGMQHGIVGSSGEILRRAISVVRAVGQDKVHVIATCNSDANLPDSLSRRFRTGQFFFDLPDAEELAAIWPIQLKRYGFALDVERPDDFGWTGAEVRNCCSIAAKLRIPLTEAAAYIVPVSRSRSESLDELRRAASGRYISASHPGFYKYTTDDQQAAQAFKPNNENNVIARRIRSARVK